MKKAIEAKISAYQAELTRNITNRRRDVIASELHKLSAQLLEIDKNNKKNLKDKHSLEIAGIKEDYDTQIQNLITKLNAAKKEIGSLNEEKRINKLKAQNLFKKLNAKLTPSEMQLFSDVLNFIRNTHLN